MVNMKDFILNELPVSKDIQNKINHIKESSLRYDDFNSFKFLMNNLENFSINDKLSDDRIKHNINSFVSKFIKELDSLTEKIVPQNTQIPQEITAESTNQVYFDYQKPANTLFYEALARVSEFNDKQETTKEEIANLLEAVSELVLNKEEEFDKEQLNLLGEIEETLKEEIISYNKQQKFDDTQDKDANQQESTQKDLLLMGYEYDINTITKRCNELNQDYSLYVRQWINGEVDKERFKEIMRELNDIENQQNIAFIKNKCKTFDIEIPPSILKDWDSGKIDRAKLNHFKTSVEYFEMLMKEIKDYKKEVYRIDIHKIMDKTIKYIKDNIECDISSHIKSMIANFKDFHNSLNLEDLQLCYKSYYQGGSFNSDKYHFENIKPLMSNIYKEFETATKEEIAISKEYEEIIQDTIDFVKREDTSTAEIFSKIMKARSLAKLNEDRFTNRQNFKLNSFFDALKNEIVRLNDDELGYIVDKSAISYKYLNEIVLEENKSYDHHNTIFNISENKDVKAFEFNDNNLTKKRRKL